MRGLKKLGAALFVVAAFGAVLASSALAAATTTDVQWYTGSSPGTVLSGSETISSTLVGGATFDVNLNGLATYTIKATGVECIECRIENSGATAVGSGKLKFTGVTIVEPEGCSVPSTITTKSLSFQADWMSGSTNYWRFVPTAGETTTFVTIPVEGCPLATTLNIKGSVFGETANATGTQAVEQEVRFSEAINTAAGGAAGTLKVGTSAVNFTAAIKFKLTGGQAFGTH